MESLNPCTRNALLYALNDPGALANLLRMFEPLAEATPGQATAGKALVADAYGAIAVDRVRIGPQHTELLVPVFEISAGGSGQCIVRITLRSADDSAQVLGARPLLVWLSDDSAGRDLTWHEPDGGLSCSTGSVLAHLAADRLILATTSDGESGLELLITDSSRTLYYVAALPLGWGQMGVSRQLRDGDYG